MNNIDIVGEFNFPYQFIISDESDHNVSIDQRPGSCCNKWCNENCKGMWYITSKTVFELYAPTQHISLLDGMKFPSTKNVKTNVVIIAFQNEDEAMAFKLSFMGE